MRLSEAVPSLLDEVLDSLMRLFSRGKEVV